MSKILLIALAALIVISLAACSAPEKAEETVEAPAAEAKAATTPEPTPEPTPESTPTPTPEPIAVVLQSIPLARIAEADIPKHEKLEVYAREILAQADAKKTEAPADMEYVEIPWIYEVVATGSDEIAKDLSFTVYSFTDKDDNVHYRAWGQKVTYKGDIEAEGFYEIAFTEDEDSKLMLEFDGLTAEPVDLEKEKAMYPKQPNKEKTEKSESKSDKSTKADTGAKTDASESDGGNSEQPKNPAPKPEAPAPAPPVDKEREDFNKEQQEHIDKVVNGDGSGYDIDVEPPPDSF